MGQKRPKKEGAKRKGKGQGGAAAGEEADPHEDEHGRPLLEAMDDDVPGLPGFFTADPAKENGPKIREGAELEGADSKEVGTLGLGVEVVVLERRIVAGKAGKPPSQSRLRFETEGEASKNHSLCDRCKGRLRISSKLD